MLLDINKIIIIIIKAAICTYTCKYRYITLIKTDWRPVTKGDILWVRFPLEENKYLIFYFLRSGVEAKRDIDLTHMQRLQNSAENEEWSV